MPIKLADIRLELTKPRRGLPDKIAGRAGGSARRDRQLADPQEEPGRTRHDDIHFSYAAEVDLPEPERRALGHPGILTYVPDDLSGPTRARRRCASADHVGAGPAGLIAGYLLAETGYRPLILERGRAVKDRVADVRRFDQSGRSIPRATTCSARGAPARSATASSPRGTGPEVTRVLEILADATASRRSSMKTGHISARTGCPWSCGP